MECKCLLSYSHESDSQYLLSLSRNSRLSINHYVPCLFTKACVSILYWVSSIHFKLYMLNLLPMCNKVSQVVLTARFPTVVYVNFTYLPFVLYAPPISLLLI
jgi:hypothetical protein